MLGNLRRIARKVLTILDRNRQYLALTYASDRLVGLAVPRRSQPEQRDQQLVLLTNGAGNIGDQAMFEAFLANTAGSVAAIVRSTTDFTVPHADAGRVRLVVSPKLVSRPGLRRKREVVGFLRELDRSVRFSIVGADIMDGGYSRAEAVKRAQLLRLASSRGVSSRLLGFSWNGRADVAARAALRRASKKSELFARDPLSLSRLCADGITALEAADVVFTTTGTSAPVDLSGWVAASSQPLVVVNVSGLIQRNVDIVTEFAALADGLVARGLRVVLLPHVVRPGDDDLAACRRTLALVQRKEAVHLVERVLRPAEVAWLAKASAGVITGRMHLAILALNQGVAPIVLATQGKVEGLLRLFGLEQLALVPQPGVGTAAAAALSSVLSSSDFAEQIHERLPAIRALASRSFE